MNITIAGAGAMGSRFGLMLHQAGHKVILVDGWADHVKAIQKMACRLILMARSLLRNCQFIFKTK
ncbi:ketopantoate reductase PanE/ApbA domain protein [Streptococcus constellatus subsp. pharyngis SK1060 = CCUG 46377]|uniref:Ketopantoate reductase PanE/ApbA domain protein n=1 Tax=Streptococcus constellatus subsp. pharyngis SK1060 = CCUG 46377 TaxID=1035184 RepID=F9P5Y5_STRCV|nr:ketopantoate reductase PanE/ApbA domain protein [Streptococcus constellatus subsp. pharyngis SK1060 = CCUG 46377]